jgi:hypothetical protein
MRLLALLLATVPIGHSVEGGRHRVQAIRQIAREGYRPYA